MPSGSAGRLSGEGSVAELAAELIRDFDGDAALIAWGQADTEADHGRTDLSRKWLSVMEAIIADGQGSAPPGR